MIPLQILSPGGYSDGKRSADIVNSMVEDSDANSTNLFAPVLHTPFTLCLALLSMQEEQSEEGGKHP